MDQSNTLIGAARVIAKPVTAAERIPALDVLRAIALFFIFLVNVQYFARPLEAQSLGLEAGLEGINQVVAWCGYVLIERKAWCLFALLFGMGFAVMQQRARIAGRGFVAPYLRRTFVLLLFGMAHIALLWGGDVLHTYAFAAAVMLVVLLGRPWWLLLPVPLFAIALATVGGRGYLGGVIGFLLFAAAAAWIRRGGVHRLWKAGVMLYLSPAAIITMMTLPGVYSPPAPDVVAARADRIHEVKQEIEHAADVIRTGSYADNMAWRVQSAVRTLPDETRTLVAAVGLFLIGVWFVRAGVVSDLHSHRAMLARIAITGLPAGTALAVISASMATGPDARDGGLWTLAAQLMTLAALPASIGAACAVLWLMAGGWRPNALMPVGRMTLTNYLMQSAICTLIFYGYGFGLSGGVDRVGQLMLAIVVFAMQVAMSSWWLRRFQFGPVEWVWRSATYLRCPRMRC